MNTAEQREKAVAEAIGRIRGIERDEGVTRDSLEKIKGVLLDLAAHKELFPVEEFPPPSGEGGETGNRYLISEDPDQRFALYLNSLIPGRQTNPHDHTTWAVVVAVEGEEINHVYERVEAGGAEGEVRLREARTVVVKPGQGVALMPDDIHAIEVTGTKATRHLHMYGRSLETLDKRMGYDLEKGTAVPYNQAYMNPTVR